MQPRERTGVVCVHNDHLLAVLLRDPVSKVIRPFPPGGKREPTESLVECASREALEETGYKVDLLVESELLANYPYTWGETTYQCSTYFFFGHLSNPQAKPLAREAIEINCGVEWIPLTDLALRFNFCPPILEPIQQLIRLHHR